VAVRAHTYTFGELPLAVHDRVVEGLAAGAVLATVAWLSAHPAALELERLGVRYQAPPAYAGDPGVQHVRLGAALQGCSITCLDMAIYEAALYQFSGVEAWVAIVRDSDDAPGHAIVVFPANPGLEVDPSARFLPEQSS
jgi:hypothetical protein